MNTASGGEGGKERERERREVMPAMMVGVARRFYKYTDVLLQPDTHTHTVPPLSIPQERVGNEKEGGGKKRGRERWGPGFSLPPRPIRRIFL